MPSVTLDRSPSGLPTARTRSPTRTPLSSNVAGESRSPASWITARSFRRSAPTSAAECSSPPASVTVKRWAPAVTCALVTTSPAPSKTTPDPRPTADLTWTTWGETRRTTVTNCCWRSVGASRVGRSAASTTSSAATASMAVAASPALRALIRRLSVVGQDEADDLVAGPPRPALTDERQRCAPARPAPWLEAIGKLAQGGRQLGERCPWHATTVCRAMQRGERAWRSADTGSLRGGLAQIRQHGEHAAVLGRRRPEPELVEDARHVLLDGRVAEDEGLGDALVG